MDKLRFAIVGYGRIGKLAEKVLIERGENIVSVIDPVVADLWDVNSLKGIDTAICFTSPDAGYETTKRILSEGVDAVVGTTKFYLNENGSLNEEMFQEFEKIAKQNKSRMLYAENFSVGMNAFWAILNPLAEMMANLGYDVAVEERHHKVKADVAGTAKKIGGNLLETYPDKTRLNFRDLERKREDREITIASTRVGYVPGTHTIIFDSPTDSIELIHRVRDPTIFAQGAIDSAYWLRDQEPGFYNIEDRL